MASLTPLTILRPVFSFSLWLVKASHNWWEPVHEHHVETYITNMLSPVFILPMFMLNILNLNKLKRGMVTCHPASSPQTTVVWWNSEEHSRCSLHQLKIMGLGFSTGAVSRTCGADRHLSTSWTVQNIQLNSKAREKQKQKKTVNTIKYFHNMKSSWDIHLTFRSILQKIYI